MHTQSLPDSSHRRIPIKKPSCSWPFVPRSLAMERALPKKPKRKRCRRRLNNNNILSTIRISNFTFGHDETSQQYFHWHITNYLFLFRGLSCRKIQTKPSVHQFHLKTMNNAFHFKFTPTKSGANFPNIISSQTIQSRDN